MRGPPNGALQNSNFLTFKLDTGNFQDRQIWRKAKILQNLEVLK